MKLYSLVFSVFFVLFVVEHSFGRTLYQLLGDDGDLSVYKGYIEAANLATTLGQDNENLTVFAPTNEGVQAFRQKYPDFDFSRSENVNSFAGYHIAVEKLQTQDFVNDMLIAPKDGDYIRLNVYGSVRTVNGVPLDTANSNIVADNGYLHYLDGNAMAIPKKGRISAIVAGSDFSFSNFNQLSGRFAEVNSALNSAPQNPHTAFVPNNAAFTKFDTELRGRLEYILDDNTILEKIVKYHVVETTFYKVGLGNPLTTLYGASVSTNSTHVGDALIVTSDIPVTNGVAHEIDTVLYPSDAFPTLKQRLTDASYNPFTKDFSTFNTYVDDVSFDLTSSAQLYTVFAPVKAAIDNLDNDDIDSNKQAFVEYHVVNGEYFLDDLTNEQLLETVGGGKIRINRYSKGNTITANGNTISPADFYANNGAFHVLETKALWNPAKDASTFMKDYGVTTRFFELVEAAGLSDLLTEDGPFTIFAPTNNAIEDATNFDFESVKSDPEKAKEIVKYHIAKGTWYTVGFNNNSVSTELGGGRTLFLSATGSSVNGVSVSEPNNVVTNGVVHTILDVLDVPPTPEPTETQAVTAPPPTPTSSPINKDQDADDSMATSLTVSLSMLFASILVILF